MKIGAGEAGGNDGRCPSQRLNQGGRRDSRFLDAIPNSSIWL